MHRPVELSTLAYCPPLKTDGESYDRLRPTVPPVTDIYDDFLIIDARRYASAIYAADWSEAASRGPSVTAD